jgi:hypothetical protein
MMDKLFALLSLLALVALAFLGGIVASYLRLPPYWYVAKAWQQTKSMFDEPDRLMPATFEFEGVKVHVPDRVAPGVTLITSYFPENDWNAAVRLIANDGTLLHSWTPDVEAIFGDRQNLPYIHGAYLFPNGDLLVSYEFVGLARISACGDVIWKFDKPKTHHSISRVDDGTFWVSANRKINDDEGRDLSLLKALSYPVFEDYFLQIDENGEILRLISSIEVLDRNGLTDTYLRVGQNFSGDIFHLNDIEALPATMADQYPLFEAGDIAVSLRDLHMLMVLDPETLEVKWHSVSDTTFQHDVDFIGDGWIGAFDNRFDRTENGHVLGGSRIAAIRPHSGERKTLFPREGSPEFYTKWSGKWQLLENGNLLMTQARKGHALEVTADGRPVWEWAIERYDATQVPEVMEATRYPYSAETVAGWSCN